MLPVEQAILTTNCKQWPYLLSSGPGKRVLRAAAADEILDGGGAFSWRLSGPECFANGHLLGDNLPQHICKGKDVRLWTTPAYKAEELKRLRH